MKYLLIGIMLLGFTTAWPVMATEKTVPTNPKHSGLAKTMKEKPLVKITTAGKLSKEEPRTKEAKVKYVLTTAQGNKIVLPETKPELLDLEQCLGKNIELVGEGHKIGQAIILKNIISVESGMAAPATPAALAPADPAANQ